MKNNLIAFAYGKLPLEAKELVQRISEQEGVPSDTVSISFMAEEARWLIEEKKKDLKEEHEIPVYEDAYRTICTCQEWLAVFA